MEQITQETRRDSHAIIKESRNTRHQEILLALEGRMTAREIASRLGYRDMNAVRPRITELVELGHVRAVGKKMDTLTDRWVSMFERVQRQ